MIAAGSRVVAADVEASSGFNQRKKTAGKAPAVVVSEKSGDDRRLSATQRTSR
ncbi:MAG: hypothetical protein GX616_01290 [Planctomycetes bacterium]|nr:hypothetical protein [Planctomycetota bacterium]